MKLIHNDKVALAWAIAVELVAHGFFAFQAFLLGGFLGEIALSNMFGTSVGNAIGSWALAIFLFGAAFQAFVLGEYMQEHVASYERSGKGDGSYMKSWKEVRLLVGAIELCSLAFRCIVVAGQGDYGQLIVTLLFGVIALRYAYAQAKVIHASVNRPVEYDVYRTRQKLTRDLVKDVLGSSDDMTASEKGRFLEGDMSVVDAAQQRRGKGWIAGIFDGKKARQEQARERDRQAQEEFNRSRDIAEKIIPGYDPFPNAQSSQANHLSQNGHRN